MGSVSRNRKLRSPMAKKPAGNPGARSNQDLATKRAEPLFLLYHAMGPTRSLERLQRYVTGLGLKTSLKTLKSYSAQYDWQTRVRELDEAQVEFQQTEHIRVISEMNNNQARLGAALQTASVQGLRNISLNPTTLSARDTGYLAEVGSKLERLARGEATTRQAVAHEVLSPVVYNIVTMFQQINLIDDRDDRQREFAMGCDAILEQAVGPLGDG